MSKSDKESERVAEDEEWPMFQPQNPCNSLQNELETISVLTHKYIKFSKYNVEDWYKFLEENGRNYPTKIDHTKHELDKGKILYKWTSSADFMNIVFEGDVSEVQVDENGIQSPVISGLWWDKASDIDVMDVGNLIQVSFKTEYEWPLPIKGGDADALSQYYLAVLANVLNNNEAFEYFIQRSAMNGDGSAMRAYGLFLNIVERYSESVHWLARASLLFGDHISAFCLAKMLLEGKGIRQDFRLAEYMLYRLCKEDFNDAFVPLAKLYLTGGLGVKPAPKRANSLLLYAAVVHKDLEAISMIDDNGELKSALKESIPTETEVSSPIDFAVAGIIVAGLASAAWYISRRFFNKK